MKCENLLKIFSLKTEVIFIVKCWSKKIIKNMPESFKKYAIIIPKTVMARASCSRGSWPGPHGQGPHGQGPHGQGPHGQGPHGQDLMARAPWPRASWPGPYGQGPHGQGLMARASWPRASWPRSATVKKIVSWTNKSLCCK